jgi:hypothetical protein
VRACYGPKMIFAVPYNKIVIIITGELESKRATPKQRVITVRPAKILIRHYKCITINKIDWMALRMVCATANFTAAIIANG